MALRAVIAGTFEDYVGKRGFERKGKKKWRECMADVIAKLAAALEPDDRSSAAGMLRI
jgi:hypothetical protein